MHCVKQVRPDMPDDSQDNASKSAPAAAVANLTASSLFLGERQSQLALKEIHPMKSFGAA